MESNFYLPSEALRPFIKYYWVYNSSGDDYIYPSGHTELAINISDGNLTTRLNNVTTQLPKVEVLGQLTMPGRVNVTSQTTLLITRFHAHAAALFLPAKSSELTNHSLDLNDLAKGKSEEMYTRIRETALIPQKIAVLESYLTIQLTSHFKKLNCINTAERLCNFFSGAESFNIKQAAKFIGRSERYVQRFFLEFVGLTPNAFFKIKRFNRSLKQIQSGRGLLTRVAYNNGYYDQAHFIKEFKSYTGQTPLQYQKNYFLSI